MRLECLASTGESPEIKLLGANASLWHAPCLSSCCGGRLVLRHLIAWLRGCRGASAEDAHWLRVGYERLVGDSEGQMGVSYQAMAICHADMGTPVGFGGDVGA